MVNTSSVSQGEGDQIATSPQAALRTFRSFAGRGKAAARASGLSLPITTNSKANVFSESDHGRFDN